VAAYLLHAPISQQRMSYDPASGTVRYDTLSQPATGSFSVHEAGPEFQQTFTALDWLAALTSHIPNRGEQTLHIMVSTAIKAGANAARPPAAMTRRCIRLRNFNPQRV
jgi:hypothetical protein